MCRAMLAAVVVFVLGAPAASACPARVVERVVDHCAAPQRVVERVVDHCAPQRVVERVVEPAYVERIQVREYVAPVVSRVVDYPVREYIVSPYVASERVIEREVVVDAHAHGHAHVRVQVERESLRSRRQRIRDRIRENRADIRALRQDSREAIFGR